MRRSILLGMLAGTWILAGCADDLPTATTDELVPVEARTAEILFEFDEIADDLRVLGGFGRTADLGFGLVALDFRDTLDVRTLVRWGEFPASAQVEDTTGTTVPDSTLTFIGGRVIVQFDTVGVTPEDLGEPPQLSGHAIRTPWHPGSATWELAVDTVGRTEAWPEPGGGPAEEIGTAAWDPTRGDTISFALDSATVAQWSDTTDATRGFRLDLESPGHRFRVENVSLLLEARPSVNPDTTIFTGVPQRQITFAYSPSPDPDDGLRLGGVPAWRTTFRLALPETIDGRPEVCQVLGCPFRLTPENLNAATLLLTPRAAPAGFAPEDSVRLDVRPVLQPDRLPRSPIGTSLLPGGFALDPELFDVGGGETVELPLTGHVRSLVEEREDGDPEVPRTLALLSAGEPALFGLAAFQGPGETSPPVLRLIVTRSGQVTLP